MEVEKISFVSGVPVCILPALPVRQHFRVGVQSKAKPLTTGRHGQEAKEKEEGVGVPHYTCRLAPALQMFHHLDSATLRIQPPTCGTLRTFQNPDYRKNHI